MDEVEDVEDRGRRCEWAEFSAWRSICTLKEMMMMTMYLYSMIPFRLAWRSGHDFCETTINGQCWLVCRCIAEYLASRTKVERQMYNCILDNFQ